MPPWCKGACLQCGCSTAPYSAKHLTPSYLQGNCFLAPLDLLAWLVSRGKSTNSLCPRSSHPDPYPAAPTLTLTPPPPVRTRTRSQLTILRRGGCTLMNQYLVIKYLGRGSCGRVFLCMDITNTCLYAVKVTCAYGCVPWEG
jgi:hypothetical protein